jgi:TPR repeat protein
MFKLYKSAADEPNLYMKDAQYNVGICFREGTGVTKDVHQAVKYL